MARRGQRVVAVSELRGELTANGDLKNGIAFQNEVNTLIAALSRLGTAEAGQGLAEVEAPFGCLPPRAPAVRERRRAADPGTALRALAISGQERSRRLVLTH